jgi:hypothetical protein
MPSQHCRSLYLATVQQNETLSKQYALDFGQEVVVTKNNTKQTQEKVTISEFRVYCKELWGFLNSA